MYIYAIDCGNDLQAGKDKRRNKTFSRFLKKKNIQRNNHHKQSEKKSENDSGHYNF